MYHNTIICDKIYLLLNKYTIKRGVGGGYTLGHGYSGLGVDVGCSVLLSCQL